MKRVTGLGGVFVKCKNKEAMVKWYTQHLGINMQDWGVVFMPKEFTKNHPGGYQVFSLNNESSNYFEPSTAPFMLNFTVADLASLLPVLKLEGVQIVKETEGTWTERSREKGIAHQEPIL